MLVITCVFRRLGRFLCTYSFTVTCTEDNRTYIYNSACYSLETVGIYGFGENYAGCFSVQKEFTLKAIPRVEIKQRLS